VLQKNETSVCGRAALRELPGSTGQHPSVIASPSGMQQERPCGSYRSCTLCHVAAD